MLERFILKHKKNFQKNNIFVQNHKKIYTLQKKAPKLVKISKNNGKIYYNKKNQMKVRSIRKYNIETGEKI